MESHPNQWRIDFPAIHNSDLVYLDNAATTHKPAAVIDAISSFYTAGVAPVHRSLYERAESVTSRYEQARKTIAQWMGVQVHEIVFTFGTTDAINLVAQAWAAHMLRPGDEIVITELEHHANSLPWISLAQRHGLKLNIIPVSRGLQAYLDPADIELFITSRTKLVATTAYSNVRGPLTHEEYQALYTRTRAVGAALLIDATQVPAHEQPLISKWNPDFLCFSSHKCFGPTGSGVLYITEKRHAEMGPFRLGGGMAQDANLVSSHWKQMPHLLEAGTMPLESILGLEAAIHYLQKYNYHDIRQHEQSLMQALYDGIPSLPGIRIIGDATSIRDHSSLITIVHDHIHAHDLAAYLAQHGIAVRAGNHCCQPLHQKLQITNSLRISCALYNNHLDIQRLLSALAQGIAHLK